MASEKARPFTYAELEAIVVKKEETIELLCQQVSYLTKTTEHFRHEYYQLRNKHGY